MLIIAARTNGNGPIIRVPMTSKLPAEHASLNHCPTVSKQAEVSLEKQVVAGTEHNNG